MGNFQNFVGYTAKLNPWFPASWIPTVAWIATLCEICFGIALISGYRTRIAAVLSGLLTLAFAMGMVFGTRTTRRSTIRFHSSGETRRPAVGRMKRFEDGAIWRACPVMPKAEDRVLCFRVSSVHGYLSAPASRNAPAETAKTLLGRPTDEVRGQLGRKEVLFCYQSSQAMRSRMQELPPWIEGTAYRG